MPAGAASGRLSTRCASAAGCTSTSVTPARAAAANGNSARDSNGLMACDAQRSRLVAATALLLWIACHGCRRSVVRGRRWRVHLAVQQVQPVCCDRVRTRCLGTVRVDFVCGQPHLVLRLGQVRILPAGQRLVPRVSLPIGPKGRARQLLAQACASRRQPQVSPLQLGWRQRIEPVLLWRGGLRCGRRSSGRCRGHR